MVHAVQSAVAILTDFTTPPTDHTYTVLWNTTIVTSLQINPRRKMRITVEMTLLVGSAAMALASPIASPGPPSPMSPPPPPSMGSMVAGIGKCPVRTMLFFVTLNTDTTV